MTTRYPDYWMEMRSLGPEKRMLGLTLRIVMNAKKTREWHLYSMGIP